MRLIIGAVAALSVVGLVGAPAAEADGICWYETPQIEIAAIDRGFTGDEYVMNVASLGFVETDYISGDIWTGRMSTARPVATDQVWVEIDGVVYPVTDYAREHSVLPDGRRYAEADLVEIVTECVGWGR
jgi:hypothetical protein